MQYISITGLKLKRFWHAPRFWFHAVRSMVQAKQAPGNVLAKAKTINGVHHTLSVWQSREAMQVFIRRGAHLKAMRQFSSMATGKTFGFESNDIPAWHEVHQLWQDKGVDYS